MNKIDSFKVGLKDEVINRKKSRTDGDEQEEDENENTESKAEDPENKEVLDNLTAGCDRAKMNAIASENNYKRTLDNLNLTVELFRTDFSPMLNNI